MSEKGIKGFADSEKKAARREKAVEEWRMRGYLGVYGVRGVAQEGQSGAVVGAGLREGQGEGHAGARHVHHLHAEGERTYHGA